MTIRHVFATIFQWLRRCVAFVASLIIITFALIAWLCSIAWRNLIHFSDKHGSGITALATIAVVIVTIVYVIYTEILWETTQNALVIGQRAYVTLGRKGGVVAEFVSPKDSKFNAGIVIYFQNSGHIPAKFNWGTVMDNIIILPPQSIPPIHSPHHFTPMTRTRTRANPGSFGESGGVTIAGDSLYATDLAELPNDSVIKLDTSNILVEIMGAFEYCDELGTYSCRQFDIYYQGVPYRGFRIVSDRECWLPLRAVKPDPKLEYLFPCKTPRERQSERESASEE